MRFFADNSDLKNPLPLNDADVAPKDPRSDDYIAWLRFDNGTIKVCDSDSPKAFRVYRKPDTPLNNIGHIRRLLFTSNSSEWNGFVRGATAACESEGEVVDLEKLITLIGQRVRNQERFAALAAAKEKP